MRDMRTPFLVSAEADSIESAEARLLVEEPGGLVEHEIRVRGRR